MKDLTLDDKELDKDQTKICSCELNLGQCTC